MTAGIRAERWALTLYVDGISAESISTLEAVRGVCDDDLGGNVDLEVIDVRQQSARAARDQIVAVPALLRRLPGPPRRIVGDLSDAARIRIGLDLDPADARDARPAADN